MAMKMTAAEKQNDREFWYEPQNKPERGDIVFFDCNREHDGGKPLDHVGIITKYENGYISHILTEIPATAKRQQYTQYQYRR